MPGARANSGQIFASRLRIFLLSGRALYLSSCARVYMARYYHLDIAAVAAQADHKWVDNLLSRFDIPGVGSAHQGVARRISTTGVYHIALARLINREMAIP